MGGDVAPWGVAYDVILDAHAASCYLCGWRGVPSTKSYAQWEMKVHMADPGAPCADARAAWIKEQGGINEGG